VHTFDRIAKTHTLAHAHQTARSHSTTFYLYIISRTRTRKNNLMEKRSWLLKKQMDNV